MKKLALVTSGIVVANVVANLGINILRSSSNRLRGAAHLALPYLAPAPLNFIRVINAA